MDDFIKRSDALKVIETANIMVSRLLESTMKLCMTMNSIAAADVVPVVRCGRWVWDGGEDMHYFCSLCHHNAYGCTVEILSGDYNYCPNCGAKMDVPDTDVGKRDGDGDV